MQERAQTRIRQLSTKCVNKSYVYLIYMYKQDLALNNSLCHKTQLNQSKNLHTVKEYQVLMFCANNFQTDLFDSYMGP